MSTRNQNQFGISSLALLFSAFVIAVTVSGLLFKGVRLDLTENRLYTLSDGTKRIIREIDEPINLYFFFSDQATTNVPAAAKFDCR